MMIKIDPTHLDGIVHACLKDSFETLQWAMDSNIFDPIELKEHKKIMKALKVVLKYFGGNL